MLSRLIYSIEVNKLKREPIRHHYIPQFILRNFCDERGLLNYFDVATNEVTLCEPRDVFMERNLYRDEINCAENPTKIETDLAKFEREISQIIKEKFLVGDKIVLTKEEDEKIKLFFFIMGFRSHNTMLQFSEGLTKESVEMYSRYQKNGNFQDTWRRNLGYLVNCRSGEDVLNHKDIDEPIKYFMMRDVFGIAGLYLVVAEKGEGPSFIVGDAYPTEVTGTTIQGIQLPMYTINPISPNRVILVVGNGVEGTPRQVLGFRQTVLYKPQWNVQEESITMRVKKLYPEEVQEINRSIANAVKKGFVFQRDKISENILLEKKNKHLSFMKE